MTGHFSTVLRAVPVVAVAAVLAMAVVFGVDTTRDMLGTTPQEPARATHEGTVTRIVVDDPHTGGWSGTKSDPRAVLMTINGREFDLGYPLTQAATVKPGDHVRIECTKYPDIPERCAFAGIIITAPTPKVTQ